MRTAGEIRGWLRAKVASETGMRLDDISIGTPFNSLGLDSIVIVTLAADLEDWLETSLDPTIFWEYPTIESLSDWLVVEKLGTQHA